ncbi:nuclear transport factor 2 family protein [Nocardioides anomalus]|uniref:nuclear transport factor 2 family protein n=1 Tax=Nocardioides anomalus TaxID=2712223 RepID=UPI001E46BC2C|nr:nuclear transport factor 2 family protein [Nocardioides anomalus]
MDLDLATTTTLATSPEELARQVRRLADTEAVRALNALYSVAVDDHDLATVVRCFAADGTFTRAGVTYRGHDELRPFYASMMDRYVTTLHVSHSHVLDLDTHAGSGTGLATGHGELALEGRLLMTAFRYDDRYVRLEDGRWVFAARDLRSMYVMPIEEMPHGFADSRRVRMPGAEPAQAAIPETLPTWTTYRDLL